MPHHVTISFSANQITQVISPPIVGTALSRVGRVKRSALRVFVELICLSNTVIWKDSPIPVISITPLPSQFPLFWCIQSRPFKTCQARKYFLCPRCLLVSVGVSTSLMFPSVTPVSLHCQFDSVNVPWRWWQWGVIEHKATGWSSVYVCGYSVNLLSCGQSGSVRCGGLSSAGAVLSMTRLLSFFHLGASFTSGDSWEKDERDRLEKGWWGLSWGGGMVGTGDFTESSKWTDRIPGLFFLLLVTITSHSLK